jgi:membrane protease YdiL (CAAX protease family)
MIATRSVICFLLLTFGVTWLAAAGIFAAGGVSNLTVFTAVGAVVMLVPAAAAAVVRRRFHEGFPDAGLRVGKVRYYALTYGLLALWAALAFGLTWSTPLGRFDPDMPSLQSHLPPDRVAQVRHILSPARPWLWLIVLFGPFLNLPFAVGEELGWRGYLLVRLLPLGTLHAVLLTGTIWGVWHAPFILMGHNYPGHDAAGVPLMVVWCIVFGWLFGWLFLKSGSVFVAALAHGCLNAFAASLTLVTADFNPVVSGATGVVSSGIVAFIAGALWFCFPPDKAKNSIKE